MVRLTLNQIFHPTDFSNMSYVAFGHALRLAAESGAQLTMLHTQTETLESALPSGSNDLHWADFPHVRQTLERWGFLGPRSSNEEWIKMGINVKKILVHRKETVHAVLAYLDKHPHDLIVLGTHQREGLDRLLHKAIAEPIVRRAGGLTLFVPEAVDGFVSPVNGAVTLQNVLIPVDHTPDPQMAVEAAAVLADAIGYRSANFTLLYVGDEASFPAVRLPERIKWRWRKATRQGEVVEQILQAAVDYSADVIAMATEGHDGFLDALRGSTTERVVRGANCPVLAVNRRIAG